MEYVTDFTSEYLKDRPILYADLIWEFDNKYSIPFEPDFTRMKIWKKIRLMSKFHYFAFYLMREIKVGCIKIDTCKIENSVKYMKLT